MIHISGEKGWDARASVRCTCLARVAPFPGLTMLSARNRNRPTILAITSGTMTRFIFGNLSKACNPDPGTQYQTNPADRPSLALLAEVCEIASLFSPKIFLNI